MVAKCQNEGSSSFYNHLSVFIDDIASIDFNNDLFRLGKFFIGYCTVYLNCFWMRYFSSYYKLNSDYTSTKRSWKSVCISCIMGNASISLRTKMSKHISCQ